VSLQINAVRDGHWITRRIGGSPFGPSATPMFATASCLHSPAFPGMTKSGFDQSVSGEALIFLVIPESRSDIRDPVPLHFSALRESHWVPAFAGMTSNGVDQSV